MILEHFCGGPMVLDSRTYEQPGHAPGKPAGLWVSVKGEYDWAWWCNEEDFHPERRQRRYIVTPSAQANFLLIETVAELASFEQRFPRVPEKPFMRFDTIDWAAVARAYDGILIAPYQWSERLSRDWYYGWDCASGCIWNTSVITIEEAVHA